jgi:cephalosporin hydroxylase
VLGNEALNNVLHALATGFTDRAVNVVAMSDEIDEEARAILWSALIHDGDDHSAQARRFGDALRALGAGRDLVNECYRVSFYAGDAWKDLSANPLFAFFAANRSGQPLDKWVHYFPIYERHLARYRGTTARVLEIGVYRGGGLELLRHYLGPEARLVGIDIDESAREAVAGRHPVETGDQEDPDFLRGVADRHGPFDIVIDDGGHSMRQQIASVETLFPLLNAGGTYIVEDSHTSYWPEYADPEPDGPTFIRWLKDRIDDLHAFHHSQSEQLVAPWQTALSGIHVYDSVAVLDNEPRWAPFSELSGSSEYIHYSREASAAHVEMLATRDAAIAQAAVAEGAQEEMRILRGELLDTRERASQLEATVDATSEELARLRADLAGSWAVIEDMRRTASWRVTAPLRRVKSILKRR